MSQEEIIVVRQSIQTYDSVHEHSLEHLLEVRRMVAAELEEFEEPTAAKSFAAAAGF